MKISIEVYQDEIAEDGCIYSGDKVAEFSVSSLDTVKAELERRYGSRFQACAAGDDGAFENSNGYGLCLVSMVKK